MLQLIARRILLTVPVLLGVTLLVFTMLFFAQGDPARLILGDDASPEEVLALREDLGLNDAFFPRYFRYLAGVLRGDLGMSYNPRVPVADEIAARLPVTARLAVLSTLFAVCVGVPAGVISAVRRHSAVDHAATVLALAGVTMPNFWLAQLLMLFFAVRLEWLPATGLYGPLSYILPVLSISAVPVATITRMTRSSMLEVIRQDYIRFARAKGQKEGRILWRHALRNALIPIITVVGLQFAVALGGAVVNEQVFAIPGLGKMMVDGIKARNYPLVQGGVLVIALLFSLLNLAVDLLYTLVDPRIRARFRQPAGAKGG